jgi:hypothetical protein
MSRARRALALLLLLAGVQHNDVVSITASATGGHWLSARVTTRAGRTFEFTP